MGMEIKVFNELEVMVVSARIFKYADDLSETFSQFILTKVTVYE